MNGPEQVKSSQCEQQAVRVQGNKEGRGSGDLGGFLFLSRENKRAQQTSNKENTARKMIGGEKKSRRRVEKPKARFIRAI